MPEPLYGSRINQYISVVITKQIFGPGIPQYSSVIMREQSYGSEINKKIYVVEP